MEFKKLGVKVLFSDEKMNGDDAMAKFFRTFGLFTGEVSNEERAKKTKAGHEKAIRDGRYPFVPPFGYKRGQVRGIPDIDPEIGPLFQAQLIRIANDLATPAVALRDYNHSIELSGIKRTPLKMDKWRRFCTDPFLCGIIEIHKNVDAYNPNGLHEKFTGSQGARHKRWVEPQQQGKMDGKPIYVVHNTTHVSNNPISPEDLNTMTLPKLPENAVAVISAFNVLLDEDEDCDECFLEACEITQKILEREIKLSISSIYGRKSGDNFF